MSDAEQPKKPITTFKPETFSSCMHMPLTLLGQFSPFYPGLLKLLNTEQLNFGIWVESSTRILEFISPVLPAEAKEKRRTELLAAVSRMQSVAKVYVRNQDREKFFSHVYKNRQLMLEKIDSFRNNPDAQQTYLRIGECSAKIMSFIDLTTVEFAEQLAVDLTTRIGKSDDMLHMLMEILQYDSTLYDHVTTVTLISLALGKRLGLSETHLKSLALGCLYHDVGIPRLDLPDFYTHRLPPKFLREYERHSMVGLDYLNELEGKQIVLPDEVYKIVSQHHEFFNGKGFPNGKKGRLSKDNPNGIHLLALIVGLADKFSLYFEDKDNKAKLDFKTAMIALNRLEGEFDPIILKIFNDMMNIVKPAPMQVGKVKYSF